MEDRIADRPVDGCARVARRWARRGSWGWSRLPRSGPPGQRVGGGDHRAIGAANEPPWGRFLVPSGEPSAAVRRRKTGKTGATYFTRFQRPKCWTEFVERVGAFSLR